MKIIPRVLFATVVLSTFAALAGAASSDKSLEEISPYRQWHRITLQPIILENFSAGG
jgi:serine protease inhibitor ecotin